MAQGAEAGGHRSNFTVPPDGVVPMVGTLALVPQVVDAVDVPVIATGGIMDGRGLAAALALGAQAVQMGTRFLVAAESGVSEGYRAAHHPLARHGRGGDPGRLGAPGARAVEPPDRRRSRRPGPRVSATRARPRRAPTCARRPRARTCPS